MVKTGLEILLNDHVNELAERQAGVLANHASVTSDLIHIADALADAGVNIQALFGPEHGILGDAAPGTHIQDAVDPHLGVPVYSLYGESKSPSEDALSGIDLMIIDLQDVGARFYTYIYTMANVMSACGKSGVDVWVLDRPNPITGIHVEGPLLEPDFASFVGMFPIPIRHGLTIGELANLFVYKFGIECNLRVIPMQGWSRDMWFDRTGLPWVMPSPNMPTLDTAIVYPGTCLFEGTNVSAGRGTTRPFEIIGAPWIDARELRFALKSCDLPGAAFRECHFTPGFGRYKDECCSGLQIHVIDREIYHPVLTGLMLIHTLRSFYPDQFAFTPPNADGRRHFNLLVGSSIIREQIENGELAPNISDICTKDLARFSNLSQGSKLY